MRNALGAAIVLLFVVGLALAIAQPGDLGDDEDQVAGPDTSTTEATTETTAGETTTTGAPGTTAPTSETTATTGPGGETTPTTGGDSGLGTGGAGEVDEEGLADTGGMPLASAGLILLLTALATRSARLLP